MFFKIVALESFSLQHRCFPVNIAKSLRTAFFIEHLWWLRLSLSTSHENNTPGVFQEGTEREQWHKMA